jgi:peroxiredoxin Q/BCP
MDRTTRGRGATGLWPRLASLGRLLATGAGALAAPGAGDPAPDFSLAGSDGRLHSLSEYRGHQGVVLAWFPRAFTPG